MAKKINITSGVVEKGLDIAKDFLSKLIFPAVEEVGLLMKDHVTMWRFNNQIRMLTRANEYCVKNQVNPKKISLKLLCPLLDYAALEESEVLQDKWALLLANMVDSDQNIENHVFPYILSQVSIKEFKVLEYSVEENVRTRQELKNELQEWESQLGAETLHTRNRVEEINIKLKEIQGTPNRETWNLYDERTSIEHELVKFKKKGSEIRAKMRLPDFVCYGDYDLEDFEISNLERLGLVKLIQRHYAYVDPHKIRNEPDAEYLRLEDVVVNIEREYDDLIVTELGKLFIIACSDKNKEA